jgi:hypothetical protein
LATLKVTTTVTPTAKLILRASSTTTLKVKATVMPILMAMAQVMVKLMAQVTAKLLAQVTAKLMAQASVKPRGCLPASRCFRALAEDLLAVELVPCRQSPAVNPPAYPYLVTPQEAAALHLGHP